GRSGEIEVLDDRLTVGRAGRSDSVALAESLSASSHHPEWFGAVVDGFFREISEPSTRGRNLAEAEQCLRVLTAAYTSHADARRECALAHADHLDGEGRRAEPATGG